MISIFSILRPTGNNMSKRPAPASNKAPNAISKRRKITSTSTATYNTVPPIVTGKQIGRAHV